MPVVHEVDTRVNLAVTDTRKGGDVGLPVRRIVPDEVAGAAREDVETFGPAGGGVAEADVEVALAIVQADAGVLGSEPGVVVRTVGEKGDGFGGLAFVGFE